MTSNRLALARLAAPIALAVLVLGGCGGEESSGSEDSGSAPSESADDTTQSESECVGKDSGSLSLKTGAATELPGGSDAAVGSTDFESDPPTASLELGDATKIERDNATGLAVGDQFGLQRGVYKVIGICSDSVTLDEF